MTRRKLTRRKLTKRVLFHRSCAVAWAILGMVAFWRGWQNILGFTFAASIYANVKSDWAAAEAADDRSVLERLDRIEELLKP